MDDDAIIILMTPHTLPASVGRWGGSGEGGVVFKPPAAAKNTTQGLGYARAPSAEHNKERVED